MKKIFLYITISLILLSCQSTETREIPASDPSDLTINTIGWVLESYETDDFNHLYINWSFLTSGSYEDLESVEINDGVSIWNMTKEYIKWETNKKGFIFTKRFISKEAGNQQGDTLRVGDYILTFHLTDGSFYRKVFTMPIPGSTSAGHYLFVTTNEGLLDNPDYAPMLTMAENVSLSRDTQEKVIKLEFTVNNPLAEKGYVTIYDKDKRELGQIALKSPFNIEGKKNNFEYPSTPLLDRAVYATISLTDGYQYEEPNYYDAVSISKLYKIQSLH